jgi:hypothetical protein
MARHKADGEPTGAKPVIDAPPPAYGPASDEGP